LIVAIEAAVEDQPRVKCLLTITMEKMDDKTRNKGKACHKSSHAQVPSNFRDYTGLKFSLFTNSHTYAFLNQNDTTIT
jgi:hypothetical protein